MSQGMQRAPKSKKDKKRDFPLEPLEGHSLDLDFSLMRHK